MTDRKTLVGKQTLQVVVTTFEIDHRQCSLNFDEGEHTIYTIQHVWQTVDQIFTLYDTISNVLFHLPCQQISSDTSGQIAVSLLRLPSRQQNDYQFRKIIPWKDVYYVEKIINGRQPMPFHPSSMDDFQHLPPEFARPTFTIPWRRAYSNYPNLHKSVYISFTNKSMAVSIACFAVWSV